MKENILTLSSHAKNRQEIVIKHKKGAHDSVEAMGASSVICERLQIPLVAEDHQHTAHPFQQGGDVFTLIVAAADFPHLGEDAFENALAAVSAVRRAGKIIVKEQSLHLDQLYLDKKFFNGRKITLLQQLQALIDDQIFMAHGILPIAIPLSHDLSYYNYRTHFTSTQKRSDFQWLLFVFPCPSPWPKL